MTKHTRTLTAGLTAAALLAVPVTGQAKPGNHNQNQNRGAASCARAHNVGFSLGGTLVSVTADNPATSASEATVTLTVRSANSHARRSGDIADQNPARRGVQVRGAQFTVPAGDAFVLRLNGFAGTDTPSVGDRVRVHGRIAVTKKRCAPAGTSVADRLGAVDVRRVTISDRDADV
jgi:hypothetical protein